jgi:RNA polymerase sigma-54 factor
MAQKLIQTQTQKQVQVQRLSQQQMLQVKLLEMPVTELEQNVAAEIDDNPALEVSTDSSEESMDDNGINDGHDDDATLSDEERDERNDRDDELDKALESISSDDEMPATYGRQSNDDADYEEMVYGETTSFYDQLKEQMGYMKLSPKQQNIMEYLIGSLDSDGLLRKSLDTISDELAIYNNIDASTKEIEDVLEDLQTFDPAGIGAQSLQECLLLQIERRPDGKVKDLMKRVVGDMFDEFIKKHWDKIRRELNLTELQAQVLHNEILKLNPKPGASLGETEGRNIQQITPDFIVDTADDGSVTFSISSGHIPELTVSPSFTDMVDTYKNNKQSMSRQAKEALLYAKEKVDKAKGFIEAIKMRRHTLFITMKAIIDWQHKFFEDGDEGDLKPMILKDIADKTGLDLSTISRVSNQKYAQTKWGTFPLRFFFSDSYTTDAGDEMSTRKIKLALKEIIEKEDKQHPMSDDTLTKLLADKGFPIARRTVAKYREQLGISVARLRRSVNS